VGKDNDVMTQPEILAWQTYHVMALIVNEAWNQEQWLDSDFSNRLRANNKELSDVLDRILTLVENMEMLVPAYFDTLHALHIAYEVGKAVVTFINYVEHQGKLVHEAQAQFSADIAATAKYILGAVEKQCIAIRKGMDEGWIDKVLECVSSDGSLLDDDNFMEEWAGEVVESWRESVAGLSYLKAS
jgi:N-terminal acetyltransferase B complex non-catalytic subunit